MSDEEVENIDFDVGENGGIVIDDIDYEFMTVEELRDYIVFVIEAERRDSRSIDNDEVYGNDLLEIWKEGRVKGHSLISH